MSDDYVCPCREKLSRIKAEKKVLLNELRALRNLGLYEGPLTTDSTKPSREASCDNVESTSRNLKGEDKVVVPAVVTDDKNQWDGSTNTVMEDLGTTEGVEGGEDAPAIATTVKAAKESKEGPEGAIVEEEVHADKVDNKDEGASVDDGLKEGRESDYLEGYLSAVLAELTERRAVVEEMRKVDPGEGTSADVSPSLLCMLPSTVRTVIGIYLFIHCTYSLSL